jgi:CBS domain-containing protein
MKIAQCMTKDALIIRPGSSLYEAAAAMADTGTGMLLVGDSERLLGAVTDRDIVVRGIGAGRKPDAPVSEVMSEAIHYCFVDDDVDRVAGNMAAAQVRRLAVLDRAQRVIGVVSFGDLAQSADLRVMGMALREITQPVVTQALGTPAQLR